MLGSSSLVVVDRADGRVLASANRLPHSTSAPPSVTPQSLSSSSFSSASASALPVFVSAYFGDVDGDGYADVLVHSSDGSLSLFTFSAHIGAALFPQLLAALSATLTALIAAHIALSQSATARQALHTLILHAQNRSHAA